MTRASHSAQPLPSPGMAAIAQVMGAAAGNYEPSDMEIAMWEDLAARFGDDALIRFARHHIQVTKFAPHISDALKFLSGATDAPHAMLALTREVRCTGPWESPRFDDAAVGVAVDYLGGWERVCSELPDPSDRFSYDAFFKRFETAYTGAQTALASGRAQPVVLVGHHDVNRLQLEQRQRLALGLSTESAAASGEGALLLEHRQHAGRSDRSVGRGEQESRA